MVALKRTNKWTSLVEGPEGVKWELGLADFALAGKMGFKLHWGWDLVTGNRKKMLKMKNGNGI